MKKLFFLLLPILFTGATSVKAQSEKADMTTVDGIITTLYDVISGPAGQARDWDLFRSLFVPEAHLRAVQASPDAPPRLLSMTPEQYIERVNDRFLERGFFEEELSRKVDEFGYVTQVFTTYQTKLEADGPVVQRGINSVQLAWYDDRYWIVSILWNGETDKHPIPEMYLGN